LNGPEAEAARWFSLAISLFVIAVGTGVEDPPDVPGPMKYPHKFDPVVECLV